MSAGRPWPRRSIGAKVSAGVQLCTDALAFYADLETDYVHQAINHAMRFVEGDVHTNGIENVWSLLKRSSRGTDVSVEPFHLFRYLDEKALQLNICEDGDGERFQEVLGQVWGRRLPCRDLTSETINCWRQGRGNGGWRQCQDGAKGPPGKRSRSMVSSAALTNASDDKSARYAGGTTGTSSWSQSGSPPPRGRSAPTWKSPWQCVDRVGL